jgi:hypothetical protein
MKLRTTALWACVALACAGAAPALAGPPTRERIVADESFADGFLTAACGIDVTTTAKGHLTVRTYDSGRKHEVTSIAVRLTATSAEGSYRFNDVGSDVVRMHKGQIVKFVNGQVPFFFTGTLRETEDGEVLKEPVHSIEGRLERACAALNPA